MTNKRLPFSIIHLSGVEAHVFAPLYGNPIRRVHAAELSQTGQPLPKPEPLSDWGSDDDTPVTTSNIQPQADQSAETDSYTPLSAPIHAPAINPRRRGRPAKIHALLPLVQEYLRLKQMHGSAAPTVAAYLNAIGNPCSERTFFTALKQNSKNIS
ncbi:MAG TPA: hypothetical protein VJB59_05030 [Bdellovibrionota bacterium]|nr:hypothetical protein [Bdellovibrionota bacterium]